MKHETRLNAPRWVRNLSAELFDDPLLLEQIHGRPASSWPEIAKHCWPFRTKTVRPPGKPAQASNLALYEWWTGENLDGMSLVSDPTCELPGCNRPDHVAVRTGRRGRRRIERPYNNNSVVKSIQLPAEWIAGPTPSEVFTLMITPLHDWPEAKARQCWTWLGPVATYREMIYPVYGQIRIRRRLVELFDRTRLHPLDRIRATCDDARCVNPRHLMKLIHSRDTVRTEFSSSFDVVTVEPQSIPVDDDHQAPDDFEAAKRWWQDLPGLENPENVIKNLISVLMRKADVYDAFHALKERDPDIRYLAELIDKFRES